MSKYPNFTLRKGQTLEFWSLSGEVIEFEKDVEVNIHGSGAGGHIVKGNGYINPIHISSTNVHHWDIWIKNDNGEEENIKISSNEVSIRKGHKVTFLFCGLKGQDSYYTIALINHDIDRYFFISKDGGFNYYKARLVPTIINGFAIPGVALYALPFSYSMYLIPFYYIVSYQIFKGIAKGIRNDYKRHVKSIINKIMEEHAS